MELAENCNWWIPRGNIAICSEKPIKCEFDQDRRLHSTTGRAVEYADGFGLYSIHGVHFDEALWTKVLSDSITIKEILAIQNADQRAIALGIQGSEGLAKIANKGRLVDTHLKYADAWFTKSEYELIDMSPVIEGTEYAPYLKMKNQTTGVYHLEGVSPECGNLIEAMTWRTGIQFNNVKIGSIQ